MKMAGNQEWITRNAFAKRVGVSAEAVSKAVETGRFSTVALKHGKTKTGKPKLEIEFNQGKIDWEANRGGRDQVSDEEYKQARRREQMAMTEIAEMKAAELAGELVRADEVIKYHTKTSVRFREGILNSVVRLAPKVASIDDVKEIETLMNKTFSELLEDFSSAAKCGELTQ